MKIISGGQTGVDRAALDVAIELGLPHGGFCPKGRRAEDGVIAPRYQLTETDSADYAPRTEKNVDAADGTLLIHALPFERSHSRGSAYTAMLAKAKRKPLLEINLDNPSHNLRKMFQDWIQTHRIQTLNVAGPRESHEKGIYTRAKGLLTQLLSAKA